MKKNTKFLVLVLALVMICLCLTGCDELDQMREEQAVWTTKDSTDSITYKGTYYKKLDIDNTPNPLYNQNISGTVYVTDPDVPVLLSNRFGEYFNISEDESFITGWLYTDGYMFIGEEVLYCRADIYDYIMSKISEGVEYTKYGFGYYQWDEEELTDIWTYTYLTSEEINAVNKVLEEVEPVSDSNIAYNETYILSLDKVSENDYFGRCAFELYVDGTGTYYLVQYSETLDMHTHYEVPKEFSPIFEELEDTAYEYMEFY